jgi:hypothetical protein
MGSVIRLIVRILNLAMDYLKARRKEASYKERQEERENVEESPTDWFGEHFSGDRVQLDTKPKSASDASKADKTED